MHHIHHRVAHMKLIIVTTKRNYNSQQLREFAELSRFGIHARRSVKCPGGNPKSQWGTAHPGQSYNKTNTPPMTVATYE